MSQSQLKNILVVRNDKLGDFMLAYPSFRLLKESLPESQITALVPEYTRPMAEVCQWIDNIIIDPGKSAGITSAIDLGNQFRQCGIDHVITLFSTTRIGLAVLSAQIEYRLAPATKIAQIFYNHRLTQRRSHSEKPEYEYNLDLARHFLNDINVDIKQHDNIDHLTPYLQFDADDISQLKSTFCQVHQLDPDKAIVFIHAGSGGSANNLLLSQYARIARELHRDPGKHRSIQIILTAGPGEIDQVNRLSSLLTVTPHTIYHSSQGLLEFAKHIQFADLFISGSTGPLHIAGALDTPTVAFYPRRRSATSLRWQTLNSEPKRLAFMPPEEYGEGEMHNIDTKEVVKRISEQFLQ